MIIWNTIRSNVIAHNRKEINEENVKSVLETAGTEVDDARVKALIAALEDVGH